MHRPVPYLPADTADPPDLVSAIRHRRGGQLLELDRMLLHSAPLARGWNAYLTEIRQNLSISPLLRELAILEVAVLNRADYEFAQHAPVFLTHGGTQSQLDGLARSKAGRPLSECFDALALDVIELTRAMTCDIEVAPALMDSLQRQLGNTGLVELVAVIATYNMVSRFLVALGVHPEHSSR